LRFISEVLHTIGKQTRWLANVCKSSNINLNRQNHIYASYMTVYLVISLPKMPYIHRIYMVLANPTYAQVLYVA